MANKNITPDQTNDQASTDLERRKMLGKLVAGGAAVAAGSTLFSLEEEVLAATLAPQGTAGIKVAESDGLSGASRLYTNWAKLEDLKKKMVKADFCGLKISRILMGGNLIGGWAHARDLIYVSDLVKAYHTREKIYATFQMGEACGINTYLGSSSHIGFVTDYWEKKDGKLLFIPQCYEVEDALRCADLGASACYVQGETGDRLAREGKFDDFRRFLDAVREKGLPAGIGAHRLSSLKACVAEGIIPDFWMKTFHNHNYWSMNKPDEPEHDNVFCREPQETMDFMADRPEPWIAFKVLAAGAIRPQDGFRFAFEGGADFLCVGMYDFQIVDSVNTCMDVLGSELNRNRDWQSG